MADCWLVLLAAFAVIIGLFVVLAWAMFPRGRL